MIKFICKNVDTDALRNTVKNAFILCVAEAISPLYGDYDRTYLDYSSCKTEKEKRLVFAEDFLGEINIKIIADGVILNDDLYVEGVQCSNGYDLKKFICNVLKEFPDLHVSGSGEIDYHFACTEYEIIHENQTVKVVYDGEKEFSEEDEPFDDDDDRMADFELFIEVFAEAEEYEYELADEGILPNAPLPDASMSSLEDFPRIALKAKEGDERAIAIIQKMKEANGLEP